MKDMRSTGKLAYLDNKIEQSKPVYGIALLR